VPQPATQAPNVIIPSDHIHRAKELEFERGKLQEQVTQNRNMLRMLDANHALLDDEQDWLDAFYAEKRKGKPRSTEEIDETKKVRKEAREEIAKERGEAAPEGENEE